MVKDVFEDSTLQKKWFPYLYLFPAKISKHSWIKKDFLDNKNHCLVFRKKTSSNEVSFSLEQAK